MPIPTEPIGSIPRPAHLIDAIGRRLAVKLDPSGPLLHSFIDLNNLALARFSAADRERIGIHVCPGGDLDSTHSDRVLEAAAFIPPAQLGTTDDCGFAPFSDDMATSRDTAFAKIRSRIVGTALAAAMLGGRA